MLRGKELIKRAKELYPGSLYMQRQWVRKTFNLYLTGNHLLLTGKFPNRDKHVTH